MLPSGIPKKTFFAIFIKSPVSTTPGIIEISMLILFQLLMPCGKCQSRMKLPLSVMTGPYTRIKINSASCNIYRHKEKKTKKYLQP